VTLDDLRWGEGQASRVLFTGVRGDGRGFYYSGRRIEGAVPADGRATAVANFGVGLPSYALGPEVYVIDLLALADPLTAHFELKERAFVPGHEKPLPAAWLAARYLENGQEFDEDQFPGGTYGVGRLDAAPQGTFTARVTTAQEVLRCEALRDLRTSYTAALTPRRFLANLFDALPRYRFRIPVEPAEARDELC
jgi:arabinofuranosyltransferase